MGALTVALVLKPQSGKTWFRLDGIVPANREVILVPGAPVAMRWVCSVGATSVELATNGPGIVRVTDVGVSMATLGAGVIGPGVDVGVALYEPVPGTISTLAIVKPPPNNVRVWMFES